MRNNAFVHVHNMLKSNACVSLRLQTSEIQEKDKAIFFYRYFFKQIYLLYTCYLLYRYV